MQRYSKAIVASIPVAIALLNVLADWLGGGVVSNEDWAAVIVTVAAALGVYQVPNQPPRGERANPNVSEQHPFDPRGTSEYGFGTLAFVVVIALAVLGLLALVGALR